MDFGASDSNLSEQIWTAENVGELLATTQSISDRLDDGIFRDNVRHCINAAGGTQRLLREASQADVRYWLRGTDKPRIDSFLKLCRWRRISPDRFLTERMPVNDQLWHCETGQDHSPAGPQNAAAMLLDTHVKHPARVSKAFVQRALEDALAKESHTSLKTVADSLGLRSTRRFYKEKGFSDLCHAIVAKNAEFKKRRSPTEPMPANDPARVKRAAHVPKALILRALEAALANKGHTDLKAVAVSLGLGSRIRFYNYKDKEIRDLRNAIVAKNAEVKKQHYEQVELIMKTALTEDPAPSLRDVAQRVGHCARLITERFPEAAAALTSRSIRVFLASRQAYRLNEAQRKMEAALVEDPAPAFSTVLKRVSMEEDIVRRTFPDLCRSLRDRYRQQRRDVRAQEHRAFIADVREALVLLQRVNLQPTFRRILASIRAPRFRGWKVLHGAVILARQELSAGSPSVHPS